VIADRVEEENIVIGLLEANVSYAQGFLFGEPRPSPELAG
jgi:EAL domain-containing protein (putative c-di-GMP-specific phosphodiesterase class I)